MSVISENAKALIAAVMALLTVIEQVLGLRLGIGEEAITIIIAVVTPLAVWLVPNRQGSQSAAGAMGA